LDTRASVDVVVERRMEEATMAMNIILVVCLFGSGRNSMEK
jgi:hypothetical protein